jgi:hypothetical protein
MPNLISADGHVAVLALKRDLLGIETDPLSIVHLLSIGNVLLTIIYT